MHVFFYGQAYTDVILQTPSYPKEDTKMRALSVSNRRGGNAANSAVVYSNLQQTSFIHYIGVFKGHVNDISLTFTALDLQTKNIDLSLSKFRGLEMDEPTAWIISTPFSRTIINYSNIKEFTAFEFKETVKPFFDSISSDMPVWFHFEGRNIQNLFEIVSFIHEYKKTKNLTISVEFEKANLGLDVLYPIADFLFFSQQYATNFINNQPIKSVLRNEIINYESNNTEMKNHESYNESNKESNNESNSQISTFLKSTANLCKNTSTLILTSGEKGAFVYLTKLKSTHHFLPQQQITVVDHIGAGDTFLGATIWAIGEKKLGVLEGVKKGVEIATKKCSVQGFEF